MREGGRGGSRHTNPHLLPAPMVESEPVQLPASGTWPLVLIVESDAIGEGQRSEV